MSFEFLVENDTNKHSLSAKEASKVAGDIGGLWGRWDDARAKQKKITDTLRPEIYLDERHAADLGEDEWKSDVYLNKIYSLEQTQAAFIWENIYQSIDRLFDVEGTDETSQQNAALQKSNLVNIFYKTGIQRTLDKAIEYLLSTGEFCLFVAWSKRYKQVRRRITDPTVMPLYSSGSFGVFNELIYDGVSIDALDPINVAFDPNISPEDGEKWDCAGKIVKSWETYDRIAGNKLYKLSAEQKKDIKDMLNTKPDEQDKESTAKIDDIIKENRIEVLQYWGNYTLDDGTVLRNWNITVIGRKYLAQFEYNRWVINPIINMAVFRDPKNKRGIPEIWSIFGIAKEQEKKLNLENDAQSLNLNPPAYAPEGFFTRSKIYAVPGKQIEYKAGVDDPNAIIKMQFPLINNEALIQYLDETTAEVSGIYKNMQGQTETRDATATEINVKVQGQTTRLSKTLDAIKQNGIVPLVTKVAELDANMKFGDEQIYITNNGQRITETIGDTVRQGHYTYKYTDNTGIQRRLNKNKELVELLSNVWNDPAVPLNKLEIVKDVLQNADFADVDKYFLQPDEMPAQEALPATAGANGQLPMTGAENTAAEVAAPQMLNADAGMQQ